MGKLRADKKKLPGNHNGCQAVLLPVPLSLPFAFISYHRMGKVSTELLEIQQEAASRTLEYVGGIQTLKAFNQAGERFSALKDIFEDQRKKCIVMEAVAAARTAACHDFISSLPDGYDTIVGEGGSTLSGGEKQRISIARALLKNAPVVLLDEATASLDPENEVLIQQAISALVADKTVIVIAHRLQSISNADQIIVLDNGSIAEAGTHDELLKKEGIYARLWKEQSSAGSWNLVTAPV